MLTGRHFWCRFGLVKTNLGQQFGLLVGIVAVGGDARLRPELLDDVVDDFLILRVRGDSMRDPVHLPCLSRGLYS